MNRSDDSTEVIEEPAQDTAPDAVSAVHPVSAVTAKNFLSHPDTHPTILDLAFLGSYGPEWLSWEAETLLHRTPSDFSNPSLSLANLTKLQAIRTLHLVDTYWQRWEVFLWVTMGLNGIFPDFDLVQVPTVAQCLVSVDLANRVRADMDWGQDVRAFLQVVYQHECLYTHLPPVDFVDVDRGIVDVPVHWDRIDSLWPIVRDTGRAPTDVSPESGQLQHMLTAHQYLQESHHRLEQQLPILKRV
jgi:hypothetical protein